MNESEFNDCVDTLMIDLEEAIDDCGVDIDYETSAGVMTLTVEADGSKIIVSRQPALRQVWVAARSGGYHFDHSGDQWLCKSSDENLQQLLSRVCSEQAGETVRLSF